MLIHERDKLKFISKKGSHERASLFFVYFLYMLNIILVQSYRITSGYGSAYTRTGQNDGSGFTCSCFLIKIATPSKSDYRAVFRGFVFCAVTFIIKPFLPIVRRSGSLAAHIINQNEKVCIFSALAIFQTAIFLTD